MWELRTTAEGLKPSSAGHVTIGCNGSIIEEYPNFRQVAQKFLDDKDKEIQALTKTLRIPVSQVARVDELDEFKKEKEALNSKLVDSQAKLLKLEEKGRQWEADI